MDWDNVTNWTDSILALKVCLANMNRLFKQGFITSPDRLNSISSV